MRLFVVSSLLPPENSAASFPFLKMRVPQPPGPGFPIQLPSVYISNLVSLMTFSILMELMKIHVIQVGKTKESYIHEASQEYQKRLGNIEVTTLKEISPSKTVTAERCVAEEGEQILKALPEGYFVVVLDEKGREMTSRKFGELLGINRDEGRSLCFVIGGAFGLSQSVKDKADLVFSMSKMTFTHQMIRPFLLEQIYRGLSIIDGKEYHNG